jgi:preprotein translocase subunit SecG
MSVVFTVLFVLTSILLIGVVLIQQPKTAGGLFSGTGQSLLGTSGKTFWTKTTVVIAAVFMVLCLILGLLPRWEQTSTRSAVTDLIQKQQAAQAQAQAPAANSQAPAPAKAPQPSSNAKPMAPAAAPAPAQPSH